MVEADAAASKEFIEWFGATLILLLTVGTQAYNYLRESRKGDEKPKHMVLETAELADMTPFRLAIKKLDQVLELQADVEATREDTARMLTILERMDRDDEVRKEVEAKLRDERMKADLRARDRSD